MGLSIDASNNNFLKLDSTNNISASKNNPAGSSIIEKLKAQANGLDKGQSNAASGYDLQNVADGALGNISDSLQRIREIAVGAGSSALYSPSDLKAMQQEIDGLKQSIQDAAKNTTFNTMKLLDGSMADLNLATNPKGGGMKIQLADATLKGLGIEDFDITGKYSIEDIDKAISSVSSARSSIGAANNALESNMAYNSNSSFNTVSAQSRLEDIDAFKQISEKQKEDLLMEYDLFTKKKELENSDTINIVQKMFS